MPLSSLTARLSPPPNAPKTQLSGAVSDALAERYNDAAKRAGTSRAQLVAMVLEESIEEVEKQVAKLPQKAEANSTNDGTD